MNDNDKVGSEEEEEYEVEKLLGHKHAVNNKNDVEYLIKWKDYPDVYNSWEKEVDIFSKELVENYWSEQPYTYEAFKNKTHKKKVKLSNSGKKRLSPSVVMLDNEKKQKMDDIKAAKITIGPPEGLTWSDMDSVCNVFHCGTSTFFAEVKWTKTSAVSFIPVRYIRANNALKLIYYYESLLDFDNRGITKS